MKNRQIKCSAVQGMKQRNTAVSKWVCNSYVTCTERQHCRKFMQRSFINFEYRSVILMLYAAISKI